VKKYKLICGEIVDRLGEHEGKPAQYGYCVLGIYLNEKHPEKLREYLDGKIWDIYGYLEDECADDLKKMYEVIGPAARRVLPTLFEDDALLEPHHVIYRANDALAPLHLLQKALAAVGIEVELEEHREWESTGRQALWAMAERAVNESG